MGNLFNVHMEDNSDDLQDDVTLDESETSTAATSEVLAEGGEVSAADAEAEDLGERVELAEDVTEEVEASLDGVKTEGLGLDRVGMSLALSSLRRIAGKQYKHVVGQNINMESIGAGRSGRQEQTRIVLEDLKDTLKAAWEAIKNAFKKAWAKIKTWYIKTFDASKKLKARATKIRDRANSSSSTIDEKTFKFASAKAIAVDGGLKDTGAFTKALGRVETLSGKFLDLVQSSKVDEAADGFVDLFEKVGDADPNVTAVIDKLTKAYTFDTATGVVDSKVLNGFGTDAEVTKTTSAVLPGDKAIVNLVGKYDTVNRTGADRIAAARRTRITFANTKDKPKEVSGESTKTLNNSEIAKICDSVIEIAENIFDFKKGWENRDRSQEKLIKEIDTKMKDVAKENEDEDNSNTANARLARSLAGAATDIVRRDSSFKAAFVSYAMNVSGVALSYCEASFKHHKK